MKKKYKHYLIDDPIYKAHLSLLIGDVEEIKKYLLKITSLKEDFEMGEGKFFSVDDYKIIIIKKYNIPILVHELIHYAFDVMEDRGIPIRIENDETITYYVEMTLKNILKLLQKK